MLSLSIRLLTAAISFRSFQFQRWRTFRRVQKSSIHSWCLLVQSIESSAVIAFASLRLLYSQLQFFGRPSEPEAGCPRFHLSIILFASCFSEIQVMVVKVTKVMMLGLVLVLVLVKQSHLGGDFDFAISN